MTAALHGAPPGNADLGVNADDLPHIVWLASLTGSVYYTNLTATEYTGHPAGTTHGWNLQTLMHPDDVTSAAVTWRQALDRQAPFDLEHRIRRHDGQYRWHAFRVRPVHDAHGAVIRWIGTATDIDDAKQVEREARASERKGAESLALLRTLQANAPIGLGFVDCDFRRVLVNDALAAFNGSTVAEQVGQLVSDLVPELWPQLEPLYRRVLQTGLPTLDMDVEQTSGADPRSWRYWRVSYYPVRIGGEVIGIGIIAIERPRPESLETD